MKKIKGKIQQIDGDGYIVWINGAGYIYRQSCRTTVRYAVHGMPSSRSIAITWKTIDGGTCDDIVENCQVDTLEEAKDLYDRYVSYIHTKRKAYDHKNRKRVFKTIIKVP